MNCRRCGNKMLRAHHEETEEVAPTVVMVTEVVINECPVCACMVKVIIPLIPGHSARLGT